MHRELYQYAIARKLVVREGFAVERAHAILMLSSVDGFIGLVGCATDDAGIDDAEGKPARRSLAEKRYPLAPSASLPAVQYALARIVGNHRGTEAFAQFLLENNAVALFRPAAADQMDPARLAKLQAKHEAFWGLIELACRHVPGWDEFLPVIQNRKQWLEAAREQAARMRLNTGRIALMIDGKELPELDDWHEWWTSLYAQCVHLASKNPNARKVEGHIHCVASGKTAPPAGALERIKSFARFGADKTGIALASTNAAGFVAHGYEGAAGVGMSLDGFLHVKAALDDLCARRAYRVEGLPGVHLCWAVTDKLDTSLPSFLTGVYSDDADAFLSELAAESGQPTCSPADQVEDFGGPVVDSAAARRATQILRSIGGAKLVTPPDSVVYHLRAAGTSRLRVQHFTSQRLHALHDNLATWFRDLRTELPWLFSVLQGVNPRGRNPYSLERLLKSLSQLPGDRQRWSNTLPPEAHRELSDAAFFGKPLSPALLDTVSQRCLEAFHRPEGLDQGAFADLMDSRLALLKLCLVRAGDAHLKPVVNPDHPHPAYQLGRLLGMCNAIQRLALGPVQASLAVLYFRALGTQPTGALLDRMLRLSEQHQASLRRQDQLGLSLYFKGQVSALEKKVRGQLPSRMGRTERALYLLGFYQQCGTARAKAPETSHQALQPAMAA